MMWTPCGVFGEAGSGYMLSGMRQMVASKMVSGLVGSICGKHRQDQRCCSHPDQLKDGHVTALALLLPHDRTAAQLEWRLQLSSALPPVASW
jgi:hypothetical protein